MPAGNWEPVKNRAGLCLALAVLLVLAGWSAAAMAVAGTLNCRDRYYEAERCNLGLQKSPARQKYRDSWLRCIGKYKSIYRHEPSSPWAAVGLYRAGQLYLRLYRRSGKSADRQAAIDTFRTLAARYPKSAYRSKALAALYRLGVKGPVAKAPVARPSPEDLFQAAKRSWQRLKANKRHQKYRDKWLACIRAFDKAYRADPNGSRAAEALYLKARLYRRLYEKSLRPADRQAADETYALLLRRFPGTKWAARASRDRSGKGSGGTGKPDDRLADLIAAGGDGGSGPVAGSGGKASSRPATVASIRYWSNPNYTRVVIDADRETTYSYRMLRRDPSLNKPRRLYIDVGNSRLGRNIQRHVAINDELLLDARAAQYTADTVRVVVDIKSYSHYKVFPLKNPFRIVVDVWGQRNPRGDTVIVAKPKKGRLSKGAIAKQFALRVGKIVIDPGHGGRDYGAPGYYRGVHEKYIVLKIAKRLKRKIEDQLHCRVIMTRTDDRYLTLEERTAIANTRNADLFISIHTNAARDKRAYGVETYILNLATNDEAIRVAARENMTSTKNISDLDSIMESLMQNVKVNESARLANYIQDGIVRKLKKRYSRIRNKGVNQAPFYVLLGADMPAVLVETSFISNPRECKRLTDPKYQDQLCQGIVDGIKRYMQEINPTILAGPERAGR